MVVFLGLFLARVVALYSQPRQGWQGARIERQDGRATVVSSGSRPLYLAIKALREEYGWVVDYEDPPYQSSYDVGTIPWPAHPGESWKVPLRGKFQCTYSEDPEMWSSVAAGKQTLGSIVSTYARSGNPGGFSLRDMPDGSLAVVGVSVRDSKGREIRISPILDTTISIGSGMHNGMATIDSIATALSRKTGIQVAIGTVPTNALMESSVTISAGDMPARRLLFNTIAATKWKMVWDLLYDPQFKRFVINISIAVRAQYNSFGNRTLVPLTVPRVPASSGPRLFPSRP